MTTVKLVDELKSEKSGVIRYILELTDPVNFTGDRDHKTIEIRIAVLSYTDPMQVEVKADWLNAPVPFDEIPPHIL